MGVFQMGAGRVICTGRESKSRTVRRNRISA